MAGPRDPQFADEPPSLLEGVDRAASGKPYLGDPEVAYAVLQRMAEAALDAPEKAEAAVRAAARVFVGEDRGYAPMGGWNTGGGLARWCRSHINGLKAHADPEDIVVDALVHLVLQLFATARSSVAPEAKRARTAALMQNCLPHGWDRAGRRGAAATGGRGRGGGLMARDWTSLLLGTPSPHPELFARSG